MIILNYIGKLFLNRNFILIFAVIMGMLAGDYATYVKPFTIWILALTMVFSTTGISTRALFPVKKIIKPMLVGSVLNYVLFGIVVLLLAWLLVPDQELFMGFVVIVAAPPGVAVIPFSGILKGDLEYSILGVFGAFLASIFLAPAIVGYFPGGKSIDSLGLFILMTELIIIPMLLSRLLLVEPFFKYVKIIRGKLVDWGFALIIFTAVGMNRQVFFSNPQILLVTAIILLSGTFLIGSIYEWLMPRFGISRERVRTQVLLLTIKSSGFSVVTAMTLFGQRAAIPSAVLAVIVLLYLLFLSIRQELSK